jgi:hypothetical protein
MLTLLAALHVKTDGNAAVITSCCGTHFRESGSTDCSKPDAVKLSKSDSECALADFIREFVGPAYGIDKAELKTTEGGNLQIVAFVYDWNGIINTPDNYHGLIVSFTQFVPTGATWQL